MRRATQSANDKAQIRTLLHAYAAALHAKDARATVALYARDVMAYDLAPPLAIKAKDDAPPESHPAVVRHLEEPIRSTAKALKIVVGKDVAYAFGLRHMTDARRPTASAPTSGSAPPPASGARAAQWKIAHCTTRCPSRWTAAAAPSSASSPDAAPVRLRCWWIRSA